MDCGPKKFYHKHPFDCTAYAETYFSDKPDMVFADDTLKFPMMNFHYIFSSGFIKGDVLVDVSVGPLIHHLYSACDIFKDIIILKLNETCTMETSKWKDSRTGAYSWVHASAHATKLEGKSAQTKDKDEQLKAAISHVISCDFENENITHPIVLPLADCVTSLWILDVISQDKDDYMRNLEKISKLLKPGGQLILFASLDMTFFTAGEHRFHFIQFDESFVKDALSKLGFVIDYYSVKKRRHESTLIDYKAVMFITACKPNAQTKDKDEQLKAAISHVISCDFENENITHPIVLPLADCVTSLWILDVISQDKDDYMRNLEKISKLLKPGGQLILFASLDMTFFTAGEHRFHFIQFDESFVKDALSKLGFVIDYYSVKKRRHESTLIDYKAVMFITACKPK